jgi:hypothetical protein
MSNVSEILDLFDNLDPYESIELINLLGERGYHLTIDRSKEVPNPGKGHHKGGLYLEWCNEKIPVIKAIRTLNFDYYDKYRNCNKYSLAEAKAYVEKPLEERKKDLICYGLWEDIEKIKMDLNRKYEAEFNIRELD